MFSIHQMITKLQNFIRFASFLAVLYITEQLTDDVIPGNVLTIKKALKLCHGCFQLSLGCGGLYFRFECHKTHNTVLLMVQNKLQFSCCAKEIMSYQ